MRILQVVPTLDPGGAERLVCWIAAHLRSHGHEVALCYFDGKGFLAPEVGSAGVEVISLRLPHKAYPAVQRLACVLRRWRPDLIHAHLPRAAFWAAMARRLVSPRTPLLYTERNMQGVYPRFARTWLFPYFAPRLQHLVGISKSVVQDFAAHWQLPPSGATVIYNGIDLSRAVPTRPAEEVRQELGASPDQPVICNIGNVSHRKGQDVLICAMAHVLRDFPGAVCWIVGTTTLEPDTTRRLLDLVHKMDLEHQVRLLGFRPDVADIMNACDVFVLSSRHEGFGLVLAEAMALCKPVVATNVGGCPEVVADGETGLIVPPEDPEALAHAILYVLTHPTEAERMGQAGRKRVEEHFTVERVGREHVELYERVLAAR